MRYVIYTLLVAIGLMLFLPASGSTQIRNLPLFIAVLCACVAMLVWRLWKYAHLITKAKRMLENKKFKNIRCEYSPLAERLHGRYSVIFRRGSDTVQIVFLRRKRKYPRYHFRDDNRVEMYRTTRMAAPGGRSKAPRVSNASETRLVGRRKIAWDKAATVRVVLFDHLPPQISDAVKRGEVGVGEYMESARAYLLDWHVFEKYMESTK